MGAEIGVMCLQVKDCQQEQMPREARDGFSLAAPRRNQACPHLGLRLGASRTGRQSAPGLCASSHKAPVCGTLISQSQEPHADITLPPPSAGCILGSLFGPPPSVPSHRWALCLEHLACRVLLGLQSSPRHGCPPSLPNRIPLTLNWPEVSSLSSPNTPLSQKTSCQLMVPPFPHSAGVS